MEQPPRGIWFHHLRLPRIVETKERFYYHYLETHHAAPVLVLEDVGTGNDIAAAGLEVFNSTHLHRLLLSFSNYNGEDPPRLYEK